MFTVDAPLLVDDAVWCDEVGVLLGAVMIDGIVGFDVALIV